MMRLFAMLAFAGLAAAQTPHQPSRRAASGCEWKPWQNTEIGIWMLVQECGPNSTRLVTNGSTIRLVAPGRDPAKSPIAIEVYEKSEHQKLKDAIERRFLSKLAPRQKAGCEFTDVTDKFPQSEDNEAWQIAVVGPYRGEATKMRDNDPSAEVCGPYGEMDFPQYFEYHPSESKTRYLFIRRSTDSKLFDEKSIHILIR